MVSRNASGRKRVGFFAGAKWPESVPGSIEIMWFGMICSVFRNQNSGIRFSASPFAGISSGSITSNAEMRPETFDFPGFAHYCGKTRKGRFGLAGRGGKGVAWVLRGTDQLQASAEVYTSA